MFVNRSIVFLLLALVLGTPASAEDGEPGYYRVSGVASNDVLNIRAEPDAASQSIGELKPDAEGVEVLETFVNDGALWGRVHGSDSDGWVSMKFLTSVVIALVPGTELPVGLVCAGTEPFWDTTLTAETLTYNDLDQNRTTLPVRDAVTTVGRANRFGVVAVDGERRLTMVVAEDRECSDGMSDRTFRWRVDLLREDPSEGGQAAAFEGCCRLPVR